jgi:RNA polymerase sigma-70 factor (ECF subfamily)
METDLQLLAAWREGDREAGGELFERHIRSLYRFFSTKVANGIDDLIQVTLTACVANRDKIREGASFRAYLFAIASNELYDELRRRVRDRRFHPGVSSLCDLGPSPSSIVARNAQQKLLAKALPRIPLDLQITIELYYWEELSGPELAVALAIPEGTVRSRLRRAREALRDQMKQISTSPKTLQSTVDDLDTWASSLRDCVAERPTPVR